MPNSERRRHLTDAGIEVLAEQGGRGLTHRAVDRRAGVPAGTTSNYFRRREDLLLGLIDRIYQRLAPSEEVATALARRAPDRALYAAYLRDIVKRLTTQPTVTLALFELRLEAARNPRIAEPIGAFLREQFQEDAAFVAVGGPTWGSHRGRAVPLRVGRPAARSVDHPHRP